MRWRNKPSEDVSWKSYYAVVQDRQAVDDLGYYYDKKYYIVDRNTREKLHGPYRDYTYAKKQARHRYKKVVRNMERLLMS